jgi:hypothetical protein
MADLDRKAIPKDLALSYRRHPQHYRDLRGRPLRSKPLLHRDASVAALSPDASAARPVPAAGSGVLELVLDAAATMPVAAVDETPVAVGDGTVYIELPAGPHVVDVQGGAARSPVVAEIGDGTAATLVWREEADRHTVRFGPKPVDVLPPRSLLYLYQWGILVFLVCGLPLATVNVFSIGETASRATVVAVAVLGLALLPFLPWRRRERARVEALRLDRERPGLSRPVHHPWDGPQTADRPALLGDRPERLPEFAPGCGALLLRATAHRHLWRDGDGVTPRDTGLAAARVPLPQVLVDGARQPATWGNWWYPLRPGTHAVEIAVEVGPDETGRRPAPLRERLDVEVRAGEATALRADAHVHARRDGEGGRLLREDGRLFLEPEEFRTEWMGDPAKRLAFWN